MTEGQQVDGDEGRAVAVDEVGRVLVVGRPGCDGRRGCGCRAVGCEHSAGKMQHFRGLGRARGGWGGTGRGARGAGDGPARTILPQGAARPVPFRSCLT